MTINSFMPLYAYRQIIFQMDYTNVGLLLWPVLFGKHSRIQTLTINAIVLSSWKEPLGRPYSNASNSVMAPKGLEMPLELLLVLASQDLILNSPSPLHSISYSLLSPVHTLLANFHAHQCFSLLIASALV